MDAIFAEHGGDSLLSAAKGKIFINCATVTPQGPRRSSAARRSRAAATRSRPAWRARSPGAKRHAVSDGRRPRSSVSTRVKPMLEKMSASLRYVGPSRQGRPSQSAGQHGDEHQHRRPGRRARAGRCAGARSRHGARSVLADRRQIRACWRPTATTCRTATTKSIFSAAHAAKDSGIALALARDAGLELPLARATYEQYERMKASGWANSTSPASPNSRLYRVMERNHSPMSSTATKQIPYISSQTTGPLGAAHLPRLWTQTHARVCRSARRRMGSLRSGFRSMTISNLGLDRDKVMEFVRTRKPTYVEFEEYVRRQRQDRSRKRSASTTRRFTATITRPRRPRACAIARPQGRPRQRRGDPQLARRSPRTAQTSSRRDLDVEPGRARRRRTTTVERWGERGPVVLAVHGMTSSRKSWERLALTATGAFASVAYDQRGHGDSAGVGRTDALERGVRDLENVAASLGEPVDALIGHSWGGAWRILGGGARAGSARRRDRSDDSPSRRRLVCRVSRRTPRTLRAHRRGTRRSAGVHECTLDVEAKVHAVHAMTTRADRRFDAREPPASWDLRPADCAVSQAAAASDGRSAAKASTTMRRSKRRAHHPRRRDSSAFPGAGHNLHRTGFRRVRPDASTSF